MYSNRLVRRNKMKLSMMYSLTWIHNEWHDRKEKKKKKSGQSFEMIPRRQDIFLSYIS